MDTELLKEKIVETLKTVYDPEIPVNIFEMGLIYEIVVDNDGKITIQMTLTSPNCPAAQSIPAEIETKIKEIEDVSEVEIEIVWEPPWDVDMMTEDAKLELGMD
tara:strand:- start:159135 stop:159446 length:312 start_codon:yes stop_codon:yes gene_type:complete